MVIDFRVRPPFKSFLSLPLYANRQQAQEVDAGDFEVHFFREGLRPSESFREASMAAFINEMDAANIESAVVMGRSSGPATVQNRDIKELVLQYPDRFHGVAGIDGLKDSPEDVSRFADEGFVGLAFDNPWNARAWYDDDKRLSPLYEAAGDLGLFVALTTGPFLGASLDYANPDRVNEVARRHPSTRFVSVHGNYPWVLQAVSVLLKRDNLFLVPDFYGHLPGMPGAEGYLQALNAFGRDRILYGSSYPIRFLEESVQMASDLPFRSDSHRSRFFSENARELLG